MVGTVRGALRFPSWLLPSFSFLFELGAESIGTGRWMAYAALLSLSVLRRPRSRNRRRAGRREGGERSGGSSSPPPSPWLPAKKEG